MAIYKKNKKDFFWLSYSDIMTSLFFIMLVLFILVYTMQRNAIIELENKTSELANTEKILNELTNNIEGKEKEIADLLDEYRIAKKELDRIREIEKTVNNIDRRYFTYDPVNKKHILNIQFLFATGSANLNRITPDKKPELVEAGKAIRDLILTFPEEENIKYLVVVEGQASKDNWEGNDKLSYYRAQSLIELWEENNIGLENLSNCEIVIAGSGEKGIPRDKPDRPPANQRFLITIVPKIGEIGN